MASISSHSRHSSIHASKAGSVKDMTLDDCLGAPGADADLAQAIEAVVAASKDEDDCDDEQIFSFTKNKTLSMSHHALPKFQSADQHEKIEDAIDFIIAQGKDNAGAYSKDINKLWETLGDLEDKARGLLKQRKRLRKRIQEVEDTRDVFDRDAGDRFYEGMFDKKPPMGKYDIRGLHQSRVSSLLASDAELTDYEPMSNKNSSFVVLKLENQIQSLNSQLKMLQDSLAFTEKGLEKAHLATRHSLVALIKMFRSPGDHNLTEALNLTPADTLPQFAGLVVTLLKLTRTSYEVADAAMNGSYASCLMKKNDALHTYVQIRNDSFVIDFGGDNLASLVAGICVRNGAKRGLCFTSQKRDVVNTKDAKAAMAEIKGASGIDIILISVEDLVDELPSDPKVVTEFLDVLQENIKLFTG